MCLLIQLSFELIIFVDNTNWWYFFISLTDAKKDGRANCVMNANHIQDVCTERATIHGNASAKKVGEVCFVTKIWIIAPIIILAKTEALASTKAMNCTPANVHPVSLALIVKFKSKTVHLIHVWILAHALMIHFTKPIDANAPKDGLENIAKIKQLLVLTNHVSTGAVLIRIQTA